MSGNGYAMKNLDTIRINYARHEATGLVAATSPDLEGFLVVGESREALEEEIPTVAADLVRKRTGDNVEFYWVEEKAPARGFMSIDHDELVRKAA